MSKIIAPTTLIMVGAGLLVYTLSGSQLAGAVAAAVVGAAIALIVVGYRAWCNKHNPW